MNKRRIVATQLLAVMLLCGCEKNLIPSHAEINEYEVLRVIGVDKSENNPAQMEMTFVTERSKQSKSSESGGGAGKKEYFIMSSAGDTLFEAERKLKTHSDKMVFFGYVDYIIVGESAAREDFGKYFDFVLRDHEFRLSPKVYITKEITAKELITHTTSEDKYIVDRLDNVKSDIKSLSNFNEVSILEVAGMLDNSAVAGTVIPVLRSADIREELIIGGNTPERDLVPCGYDILKDYKLVAHIDEFIARGYNFLTGNVKSAPVSVRDVSGQFVALEVLHTSTAVEARFSGDNLEGVTYKTHVYANVDERHSRTRLEKEDYDRLTSGLSDILRNEMLQVIRESKKANIDCIDLHEKIRMKHPVRWEKLKDQWKEIYPKLSIDVEVKADLRRTYNIDEPS
jgi:spore germination protein KC